MTRQPRVPRLGAWWIALLAALLALVSTSGTAAAQPGDPPVNRYLGPVGTSTMHGDSVSSDTTPLRGPGTGAVAVAPIPLAAACPTILVGGDGFPVALCTQIVGRNPQVYLLDPDTGRPLATLALQGAGLLGGVYAYLDNHDALVLVDAQRRLIRVGHQRVAGHWRLSVDAAVPLGKALPTGDSVVGVSPGYDGSVWLATARGTVIVVDPQHRVRSLRLSAGEQIANSISTAPFGAAIATTKALYLVGLDAGVPVVRYRVPYDRGPARKPGMLSWGTGSTPTFFGPTTGTEYLTIVDNAAPHVSVVVVDAATGRRVCRVPVLLKGGAASENSPIGVGRSIFIAGTYGYPYPALPAGAGPSVPASAPFRGGLTRVDVNAAGTGCAVVWDNAIASAAVPRYSTADHTITTITRQGPGNPVTDTFAYTVINPQTGAVQRRQLIAASAVADTLQMAGVFAPGRVFYQGTITGILRLTAQR